MGAPRFIAFTCTLAMTAVAGASMPAPRPGDRPRPPPVNPRTCPAHAPADGAACAPAQQGARCGYGRMQTIERENVFVCVPEATGGRLTWSRSPSVDSVIGPLAPPELRA